VAQSLDFCVVFCISLLVLYMLTIVLSVLLQYTASDHPSYFRFTTYFLFNVVNAYFNNIPAISCVAMAFIREGNQSTRKKNTDIQQVTYTIYHIKLHRAHFAWLEIERKTLVVIGTDCIGSSTYHTITTTIVHSEILEGRT
jgi:N-acyl-L-homoserine lactone synthetase